MHRLFVEKFFRRGPSSSCEVSQQGEVTHHSLIYSVVVGNMFSAPHVHPAFSDVYTRVPAVTWRHPKNQCVLVRSSCLSAFHFFACAINIPFYIFSRLLASLPFFKCLLCNLSCFPHLSVVRSSQPRSGAFGRRCEQDERLLDIYREVAVVQ